jgi:hypothetical protein
MTILHLMLLIYSKCAEFRKIKFDFFEKIKKQDFFFVKRLEKIMSILVKKVYKNDIISLVKIQIYSKLIFLEK